MNTKGWHKPREFKKSVYLLTSEVNENIFMAFFRWIGLNKKGNFEMNIPWEGYKKGDILYFGGIEGYKILKKII